MRRIQLALLVAFAVALLAAAASASPTAKAEQESASGETAPELAPPADLTVPPVDAEVTESGLASMVLVAGTGELRPRPGDTVRVHYTGWTTDGQRFDSSVARGRPSVLPVDRLIEGWQEGLRLMVEGEKRRLWIPEMLAYAGQEDRPAGTLVFDVELLEVLRLPPVPKSVAEPPATAERAKSGLAWEVLEEGSGTVRPRRDSIVSVHYTGWTTDGERFDSSIPRGVPSSFKLNKVIRGWTEGLQLMVEGEKRRFWIPKKLAYRGQPGLPEGMLVFEIELVEITKH